MCTQAQITGLVAAVAAAIKRQLSVAAITVNARVHSKRVVGIESG
jgi:hypothetical protein